MPYGNAVNIALILVVIVLHAWAAKRLFATIEAERELSWGSIARLFVEVARDRTITSRAELQAWTLRVLLAGSCLAVALNLVHLVTFAGEDTHDAKQALWRILHVFYAGGVMCVDALISDCRTKLCVANIELGHVWGPEPEADHEPR